MIDTDADISTDLSLALTGDDFRFAPTGLVVGGRPTYEAWEDIGCLLAVMQRSVHFWIGDWLNYGEARWPATFAQALDPDRFSYQTLANDKWVASKIRLSLRKESLSYTHHALVAPLEEAQQRAWLDRAEAENMTTEELRRGIQQAKRLPTADNPGVATIMVVRVIMANFRVEPAHLVRFEEAAKKWAGDLATLPGVICDRLEIDDGAAERSR